MLRKPRHDPQWWQNRREPVVTTKATRQVIGLHRLHSLGLLSDWHYRSTCIELGKPGYRSGEPVGVDRETSMVLAKLLTALWSKRMTRADIARDLAVPLEEIETLVFGLTGAAPRPPNEKSFTPVKGA